MATGATYLLDVMTIDGRQARHYMCDRQDGEVHIVQHDTVDGAVQNDYQGPDNNKADAAYHKITTRMLRGKE